MQFTDEIQKITSIAKEGGIFLYPTDTVWGIGCDAFNEAAVNKISSVKQQSTEKGFVLLVSDQDMLKTFIPKLQPKIQNLVDYHTKPVSIVYKEVKNFPKFLLKENNSLLIRITNDDFCKKIITAIGNPIISTTANVNEEAFPPTFSKISPKIINQMDYVVQYRQNDLKASVPSVIVTLSPKGDLIFLRN